MGHPLIDEFCRVAGVQNCQPHFFNRCQRVFRDEIQPAWDAIAIREREIANLRAQVTALETELAQATKKATRREAGAVA
jgi:hypothetical protein